MAKNSTEGNKARTARYRTGLAARGIRPVQLYAPEGAHALLRQAAGLMSREQSPLEPRQALRHASGANNPAEASDNRGREEQALAAVVEAVKAELAEAQDLGHQAEQRALAQAEVSHTAMEGTAVAVARAEASELVREAIAGELRAAKAAAAQAQAEAERFRQVPGLRGRVVRWLIR